MIVVLIPTQSLFQISYKIIITYLFLIIIGILYYLYSDQIIPSSSPEIAIKEDIINLINLFFK
jgi:hypothetical protein